MQITKPSINDQLEIVPESLTDEQIQ